MQKLPSTFRQTWLRFLIAIAALNLVWEAGQMPLYTLWQTGTPWEITYAILHCTIGDILIAAVSLATALKVFGATVWPDKRYGLVAGAAMVIAVGYTLFSEWWNVEIRQAWAYRDIMPRLPGIGTGLSPVMQWLFVPALAFWLVWPRSG
ncbi:MAG: hypothetical protein FD162_3145 [Rhodobacteraceae bacterium]|nr:MAG: hypothetical protein FD162_3145 [Paracoccaceae bacterium]